MYSFSQFCAQKQSLGCHGNKGRSEANFDDGIKLLDPFGANSLLLSSKMPELLPFEVAIGTRE